MNGVRSKENKVKTCVFILRRLRAGAKMIIMDYIELTVPVAGPEQAEILTAYLSDFPFDSFEQGAGTLKAYAPADAVIECKEQVDAMLAQEGVAGQRYIMVEAVNWNAVWESNFEPVDVDGQAYIRAPFHAPSSSHAMEVVIMPKMSFGTGHHATTHLMGAAVMRSDVAGLRGLDMGSGTGVLAILAARRGAAAVDAVDIDEWAYENAVENIAANGVADRVTPLLGDVSAVAGRSYDFILANINLNILVRDMAAYAAMLRPGGRILLSGIFTSDLPALSAAAAKAGFAVAGHAAKDGWACVEAVKEE